METSENKQPLISIIIPCFNREKYISDAIDSCLKQTYKNIEIIVVDDGSTDNSVEIIKSKYYDKLKLIVQVNQGSASARNAGLFSAKGEFIIFLDSDDWLSDDLVEAHVNTINKWQNVEICCADSVTVTSDGTMSEVNRSIWPTTPSNPIRLFLLKPPPFPACEIYRKSTILKHGGFDEQMRAFTDSVVRLKITLSGGLVVRTDGGFAVYRPVENSITRNSLNIHKHAIKLVKILSATDYAQAPEISNLLRERLIAHRLRYWNSWLEYHFSLRPISILKFIRQLIRVTSVDRDYILFIIKQKPWKLPSDRSF
jgi:glycosyltransferase involved in cell wall biosynthesis